MYYRLFWSEENRNLGDAVQDYYELFPFEASEQSAAYFYSLMFDENMVSRDYLMLHRAVSSGLITEDDANYFSQSNILIARGLIYDAMSANEDKRRELCALCGDLISKNMQRVTGDHQHPA